MSQRDRPTIPAPYCAEEHVYAMRALGVTDADVIARLGVEPIDDTELQQRVDALREAYAQSSARARRQIAHVLQVLGSEP